MISLAPLIGWSFGTPLSPLPIGWDLLIAGWDDNAAWDDNATWQD